MCVFENSKQHREDVNPCIVPEDKIEHLGLDLNLVKKKEEDEKEKEEKKKKP